MIENIENAFHELNLSEAKEDQDKFSNYLRNTRFNIEKYIQIFKANKQRLAPQERDIYYQMKKSPDEFMQRMLDISNTTSKSAERIKAKTDGASKIFENDDFLILNIADYDAAKYYGKHTKWCLSGNFPSEENKGEYYFKIYLENDYSAIYFVLSKKSEEKWCICMRKNNPLKIKEIWNAANETVENIPGLLDIPEIGYEMNRTEDFEEIDV